ncbi:MAG: hypothetical protein KDB16_20805 [Acidimicrobiales bacterium]|nr:hypothetical protein [Acidimicrobiales bacterium]
MKARAGLLTAILAPTLLVAACSRSDDNSTADPVSDGVAVEATSPTTRVPSPEDISALAAALAADDPSPPEYTTCIAEAVAHLISAEELGGIIDETRRSAYNAAAQTCFSQVYPTLDDDPAIAAFVQAPRTVHDSTAVNGDTSVSYRIDLPEVLEDQGNNFGGGNVFANPEPARGAPTFAIQIGVAGQRTEPLSLTQAWDRLVDGSTDPEGLAWATVDGITSVVTGADAMTLVPVDDTTWLSCRASIRGQASPMTQGVDDVARELLEICASIRLS